RLERRAQRAAWPAPLRPEVHDHRNLARALDDAGFEIALVYVEDHASSLATGPVKPGMLTPGTGWRQNERGMEGGVMEGSVRGKLLIASPALVDPNFARTVVFITEHNEEGAMGIVLNRPSETSVESVVPELAEIAGGEPVYVGGPVQPEALVLLADFSDPDAAAWIVV